MYSLVMILMPSNDLEALAEIGSDNNNNNNNNQPIQVVSHGNYHGILQTIALVFYTQSQ